MELSVFSAWRPESCHECTFQRREPYETCRAALQPVEEVRAAAPGPSASARRKENGGILGQAFAEATPRSGDAAPPAFRPGASGSGGGEPSLALPGLGGALREAAVVLRALHPTRWPCNAARGDLFNRLLCVDPADGSLCGP